MFLSWISLLVLCLLKNVSGQENVTKTEVINFSTRTAETPKLAAAAAAAAILFVYGVDSRLNYLATAKSSRRTGSNNIFN